MGLKWMICYAVKADTENCGSLYYSVNLKTQGLEMHLPVRH